MFQTGKLQGELDSNNFLPQQSYWLSSLEERLEAPTFRTFQSFPSGCTCWWVSCISLWGGMQRSRGVVDHLQKQPRPVGGVSHAAWSHPLNAPLLNKSLRRCWQTWRCHPETNHLQFLYIANTLLRGNRRNTGTCVRLTSENKPHKCLISYKWEILSSSGQKTNWRSAVKQWHLLDMLFIFSVSVCQTGAFLYLYPKICHVSMSSKKKQSSVEPDGCLLKLLQPIRSSYLAKIYSFNGSDKGKIRSSLSADLQQQPSNFLFCGNLQPLHASD